MSRVTSDLMTITIDGTDYSNYINSVNVSGGAPIYSFIKLWNGRKKRAVTGYTEWEIEFSMLVETTTELFIEGLTDVETVYNITIGDVTTIERTYNNMYVSEFSESMESEDGLQMVSIKFIGEGLPSNRT